MFWFAFCWVRVEFDETVSMRKQGKYFSLVDFFVCLMHNIFSATALFLLRKKAPQYSALLMFLTRREIHTWNSCGICAQVIRIFFNLKLHVAGINFDYSILCICHIILYTCQIKSFSKPFEKIIPHGWHTHTHTHILFLSLSLFRWLAKIIKHICA